MTGYVLVVTRFEEDNKPKRPYVVRKVFKRREAALNEQESIFEKENYNCGIQTLEMDIIE